MGEWFIASVRNGAADLHCSSWKWFDRNGDVATMQCAVCTEMTVTFCGKCSVLAWCFFFLLAPLMYRLEVCLKLCTCWGCVSPVWKLNAWDANWRYHRPASKWMFKTKKKPEGGRKGGWERERGKRHIGALWRMDSLVQLLLDSVNSYCSNSVTCFHLCFVPLLLLCPVVSLSSSLSLLQTLYSCLYLSLPLDLS